jgi:hypothetical protein
MIVVIDTFVPIYQDLLKGSNTLMPVFDFQDKRRVGLTPLRPPKSGVVSFFLTDVGDFLNF